MEVQIRQYNDKRVLVLLASGTTTDKHYPRGDNFWDSFTKDSGVDGLRACLNGGNTGWGGMACPDNLPTPSGYVRGQEADGAVFFEQSGGSSCNYSLSASVSNPNPGCGAQVTLNGGCSGDCGGLSYQWTGNGVAQNGQNVTISVPASNGTYTYTLTASRSGCSKSVTTQLTVSGCGGGTPPPSGITAGNCYRIRPLSNTANALGVSGSQTVVQQAANGQNSQLWKAEDVGGGQFRFVTQNGSGQAMRVASDNFGEAVRLAAAGSDYLQKWSVSPSGSDYRVSLGSGSTWDMRSAGGEPDLQLWGTTGNDPVSHRTFRFETVTCPGGTPPPPPPTGGSYNGHFDMASCSSLLGWVWNSSAPGTRLTVEVVEGSQVVATGTANRYRQDLQQAGIGDGQYAFDIPTPASLKNNQPRTISVRVQGTGYILNNSPRTITCPSGGRMATPSSAEKAGEWRLMPNPAGDEVTLEAPYPLNERRLTVKLTALNGSEQVVSRRSQQVTDRQFRLQLRELNLPAGLYLISVSEGSRLLTTLKLVKQ